MLRPVNRPRAVRAEHVGVVQVSDDRVVLRRRQDGDLSPDPTLFELAERPLALQFGRAA
jgi:hypothetical protein